MNGVIPVLIRTAFTFVAFLAAQYLVPWYLLVVGGMVAALFLWFTDTDRQLALGVAAGSVLFGIFAYLYGNV